MKLAFGMFANNPLLTAITTNDLPALRSLLENQDRLCFSHVAQSGTPEIAAYLLYRHPTPEDYSQDPASSNPIFNPTQYLAGESARTGNTALFHYLINQYPSLLSTNNRAIEKILVNAIMEGGVGIWQVILAHDPNWKDHEFRGHRGSVLEIAGNFGKKEVLEFLLKEGADTAVLELVSRRAAGTEILELLNKYGG